MLLAGLLSDTLVLTSPTTTERDQHAAERLGRWAFVHNSPLMDDPNETHPTVQSFGEQVLQAGAGLSTRDPREIVSSDLKLYQVGKHRFAIAQVEVTDLLPLDEHLDTLEKALDELRLQRGLDFTMLMVTDVVGNSSRLVLVHAPPILDDMPYLRQPDGTFLAEGVVSRKKQLLPVVFGLLEE